ncbi:MAG: mechanosensitive ion channel family protein [Coriobacteriales bacterium]|jgi:small-conductance mechanosensitive channel|nr:mechanosensitive ion channel family protein [Coriobacteriales bacterium]
MDIENLISGLSPWTARLITGIVIFLMTFIVVKVAEGIVNKLAERGGSTLPSGTIFRNIIRVTLWLIGLSMILSNCFGIDAMSIVAALGVGGIAISLGFQDTLSNLIGGLQVSLGKLVQPGEYIETGSAAGLVKDVTWRHTLLVDIDGNRYLIPNALINKNTIVHLSDIRDVDIDLLVPSGSDLGALAEQVVEHATRAAGQVATIAGKGVRMLWEGTAYGGTRGTLRVSVARSSCSDPRMLRDRVFRAIEDDLATAARPSQAGPGS